jgi:hypothetical protein
MTLRFSPATGRLWATDDTLAGAPVVFDTDDGLLFVDPADVFVGSVAIPARTASSTGVDGVQTVVDTEQDYFIGVCSSPGSRYVRGMIRTTASASGEMMDAVWRQASGTHLDIMDGVSQTMVPQTDLAGFNRLASLRGFTFFVNELGHLVLRERSVARARDSGSPPGSVNRSLAASTVAYRLLVGSFFGADFTPRPGVRFLGWDAPSSAGVSYVASAPVNEPSLGYVYPARRIAIVVAAANADPTIVTLNGLAATKTADAGAGPAKFSVWEINMPTGLSATMAMTFPSNQARIGVGYYALANAIGPPTPYFASVGSGDPSVPISVSQNQMGIAAFSGPAGVAPFATPLWANADHNWYFSGTPSHGGAVIPAGIGSGDVSALWNAGAGDRSIFAAVWS